MDGLFQSTHPSGVRPVPPQQRHMAGHFNPRTPVGCDTVLLTVPVTVWVFQSTHPSGVRRIMRVRLQLGDGFQSTHPSGVRRILRILSSDRSNFNPRTPVGCDPRTGSAG